jgi:hypothetical protein
MVKSLQKMIEHRIATSPAQMRKLMSGGAITLKPANFDPASRRMLMVMPNTSRRIATAMRKNKGVRIMLKPDEDIMEETEGGKISLKKVGRDIKRAFTSPKAIKTYKEIGKEVLPIAKGIADAGVDAGSKALASYIGNPALAPVIAGTAKVGLDAGYSRLGREVGLDPNAPVPTITSPEQLQQVVMSKAEENIRKRTKGRVRDAGLAALSGDYSTAQQLGMDYAIDKKLSGAEQKIARKAQRGEYQSVQELANDYAAEKMAEATKVAEQPTNQDEIDALMRGGSIMSNINTAVRKTRKGLRIGGASAYRTPAYESALRSSMIGAGVLGIPSAGYDMRGIMPTSAPSAITQLGGPYQRLQSPSMSPFISASPQLANKAISGGSFLPAGARMSGRGFAPAG